MEAFHIRDDSSPFVKIRPSRNLEIRLLNAPSLITRQFINISRHPNKIIAVLLNQIMKKCILVSVPLNGQQFEFVIQIPNPYEVH